jgi:uncharacterized protein (DUF1778 family)
MSAASNTSLHLDVPVPGPAKDFIERAARAAGQTVDEFAATALVEKAEEVLRGPAARPLSAADARRFLDLLDNPPAPNDALKSAARRCPPHHG